MNFEEKIKLTHSFIDDETILSLNLEETCDLYRRFPEIMRKALLRTDIDREKCVYFTPYEKEAKRHAMRDLPLSIHDFQRLHESAIYNPDIYMDDTMYDLYLALLTHKKIPNIGEKTRDNLIIGLRIFRDFVKESKKVYPNDKYGLLSKEYNVKSRLIDYKWNDIVEYVLSEMQGTDKGLICAQREPKTLKNGTFHLTESDRRTKHVIAQYSLVDELIDGNLEKSVGRLIIHKG